ncbi:MAG: hypothetical protein VKN33_02200 [Candidatus Sericytochromatia bacterium]|nr:hypothetical protein [Candidatus Sericytochromatia bacterium]
MWRSAGQNIQAFLDALPEHYQIIVLTSLQAGDESTVEIGTAVDRRLYYLLHQGDLVGVLDTLFIAGEFVHLLDEADVVDQLPEELSQLWRDKEGDLNAFLQAMEDELRRFNYLEALPDETPEALAAEMASDRAEIKLHWERGLQMRDRFLFLRALRELEVAASLCDKYAMVNLLAELCNEMGNIFIAFEDYDAATEVMEEGLMYRSTDVVSNIRLRTNLSQAYELAGKPKKALETIEQALQDIPENIYDSLLAGLYGQAASLYNQEGNYERAIQLHKLAAYLADNSQAVSTAERAMLHNNLGSAYLEHGELKLAIEQFELAVTLQPDELTYQDNLGHVRERMNE